MSVNSTDTTYKGTDIGKVIAILGHMVLENHYLLNAWQVLDQEMRGRQLALRYNTLAELYDAKTKAISPGTALDIVKPEAVKRNKRVLVWYYIEKLNMQTNTVAEVLKIDKANVSRFKRDFHKIVSAYIVKHKDLVSLVTGIGTLLIDDKEMYSKTIARLRNVRFPDFPDW